MRAMCELQMHQLETPDFVAFVIDPADGRFQGHPGTCLESLAPSGNFCADRGKWAYVHFSTEAGCLMQAFLSPEDIAVMM